ncbi:short-chain dehydrogenase/reductase SDR [Lineolata rhizophorae]|uniref:Short-chain dehydrogenase/reductase SDR n=1 Tax=Lineolata rhizophorae TaxID=578093 RepID=A0A6A6NUU9_9PEZI|nr:short-chain dehydrogenase/reductase SDR [Lineolata rhizophorae]
MFQTTTTTTTTSSHFASQVVLITGCSSGIGLATTHAFLRSSARVFGVDVAPAPPSLTSHAAFGFRQVDLAAADGPRVALAACAARYGHRVDVLCNVAGVMDASESVDALADDVWDRVLAVNLSAPVRLMREVLPLMRGRRAGAVVNVVSKAGLSGAVAGVAYTASKHGLVGATKQTAWRFADEGIRCNAVAPGVVATNISDSMNKERFDAATYARMKPVHELHVPSDGSSQILMPDDITSTILFLASDLSSKITGAVIPIDNGWSCL